MLGLAAGLALALSGMADPSKVLHFLDFTGVEGWDPQLAFVMGGAVAVNVAAVRVLAVHRGTQAPPLHGLLSAATAAKASSPLKSAPSFAELRPLGLTVQNMRVDAPLLLGAALFGAGWGLSGVCPGPAIVNFASGTSSHVAVTAAGVVAGMAAFEAFQRARAGTGKA